MAWIEVEPDFKKEDVKSILQGLPFDNALNILSNLDTKTSVIIKKDAQDKAYEYVSSIRVESGGLLIGRVFDVNLMKDIVLIEDCVFSDDSDGTPVSLKMNSSLWTKAKSFINEKQFVVGWFHSHPNLGAYFSGTDRATQNAFFRENFHIGWCIDPIRKENAWFYGQNSIELNDETILRLNYV